MSGFVPSCDEKRRIAHPGAASSSSMHLLQSLAFRKRPYAELVRETQGTRPLAQRSTPTKCNSPHKMGNGYSNVLAPLLRRPGSALSGSGSDDATSSSWLCKPRFACEIPPSPEFVHKRRRAVIVSSSSEEEDDGGKKSEGKEQRPAKQQTLRSVRRAAKREKRLNREHGGHSSDDERAATDSDRSVRDEDDSSHSDGSQNGGAGSRRWNIPLKELRAKCLAFFNTSEHEELCRAPKCNAQIAEFICKNRPFASYDDLCEKLAESRRGNLVAEAYVEHLEGRGMLEMVLDDCARQSQHIKKAIAAIDERQLNTQPASLNPKHQLHPYQQVGLNWLIMMHKLQLNSILGDEMGLGKTIQVIAFLTHLKDTGVTGPHLIVVPSSTIDNWLSELHKWSPDLRLVTYYGNIDERRAIRARSSRERQQVDVLLTTYNMICSNQDDRQFFKTFKLHYIIYDEGHMLKNCNTSRYKNLIKIKGKRKILLTGTPLQNNLCELIALIFFAMTDLFVHYANDIAELLRQFQQKTPSLDSAKQNAVALYEKGKIEEAKAILEPFILRRLKANVLKCLPRKHSEVLHCAMVDSQAAMYRETVALFAERVQTNQKGRADAMSELMQLRQIANHPLLYRAHFDDDRVMRIAKKLVKKETTYRKKKVQHVAEDLAFMSDFAIDGLCRRFACIADSRLDERLVLDSGKCRQLDRILPEIKQKGDKVLLFTQFVSMLDILEVYMTLREHAFLRFDGSTPVLERQQLIDEFNENNDVFIFLLSTKAGGLGINLAAANVIILHDIDYNPYNDRQAEDRCHRMGQTKEVRVIRMISKDTVEEAMLECAQKKLMLERQVTGMEDERGDDGESESQTVENLLMKALGLAR